MAQTILGIWNTALSRAGHEQPVEAQEERSVAAEACRLHYQRIVDELFEEFPWPFASTQARLSLTTSRDGWAYAYTLPADFVALRGFIQAGVRPSLSATGTKLPHEVQAGDSGGLVLLCDAGQDDYDAIRYTQRQTTAARFTAGFANAVAWSLASELVRHLRKDVPKGQALEERAVMAAHKAFSDSMRGMIQDDPDSPDRLSDSLSVRMR